MGGRFAGTKASFDAMRKRVREEAKVANREATFREALEDAVRRDWVLEVLGHWEAVQALPGSVSAFAVSVRSSLFHGLLSDRQVETLAAAIDKARADDEAYRAKREKELAESVPAPEGKQVVTGTILSVKTQPNNYSYYGGTIVRMTVKDHRGFRVNGVCPASLLDLVHDDLDTLRGAEVTFEATLERSKDDETFAFAKRPARACLIY